MASYGPYPREDRVQESDKAPRISSVASHSVGKLSQVGDQGEANEKSLGGKLSTYIIMNEVGQHPWCYGP